MQKNTLVVLSMITFMAAGSAYFISMQNHAHAESEEHQHEHAHQHDHEHERIAHYAFAKPKTLQEAKSLFDSSSQKISTLMESKTLNATTLEAIHETSYALEAAVDAFRSFKSYPETQIDNIDEAVQALHYASENHEEAVTREWFAKLTAESATLVALKP